MRAIGGPTVVLEIGGLRAITDPTFDPPGSYDTGRGFELTKLRGPAIGPDELAAVDAALVSHEHHFDNLDREGRAYLARVPRILTTQSGAARLGERAEGLAPWDSTAVRRPGASLSVTAVPAPGRMRPVASLTAGLTAWTSASLRRNRVDSAVRICSSVATFSATRACQRVWPGGAFARSSVRRSGVSTPSREREWTSHSSGKGVSAIVD